MSKEEREWIAKIDYRKNGFYGLLTISLVSIIASLSIKNLLARYALIILGFISVYGAYKFKKLYRKAHVELIKCIRKSRK